MKSLRAFIFGAIGLAILDGIVSHQGDAQALGGAWKTANSILEKFLSPAVGIFGATTTPAKQPAKPTTSSSTAPAAAVTTGIFATT